MTQTTHLQTVVLATNNEAKVRELKQMMQELPITIIPQSDFIVPEVEETGLSFVENAIIKARNAAQHTSLPALADDSGLEVDALNGAPGIYSARFAGASATDQQNIQKVLGELLGKPAEDRTARFKCILVFMRHEHDPSPVIFQGTWEGKILSEPKGFQGFGYDPIFYVPTHHCSAAELPAEVKNVISHRAQAFTQFVQWLRTLSNINTKI